MVARLKGPALALSQFRWMGRDRANPPDAGATNLAVHTLARGDLSPPTSHRRPQRHATTKPKASPVCATNQITKAVATEIWSSERRELRKSHDHLSQQLSSPSLLPAAGDLSRVQAPVTWD